MEKIIVIKIGNLKYHEYTLEDITKFIKYLNLDLDSFYFNIMETNSGCKFISNNKNMSESFLDVIEKGYISESLYKTISIYDFESYIQLTRLSNIIIMNKYSSVFKMKKIIGLFEVENTLPSLDEFKIEKTENGSIYFHNLENLILPEGGIMIPPKNISLNKEGYSCFNIHIKTGLSPVRVIALD